VATFDLNLLPIHRLNGQDLADMPGLLALTAPRRTARGREKDSLIIYLMMTGNATFTTAEIDALNRKAATIFYQSAGTLTSAMRKAAESINAGLLERNLSTTGRGLHGLGWLVLAVVRDMPGAASAQCTLLLSGPTHVVWVSNGQARHIHDPALSGKGLGSGQSIQSYFSQLDVRANDLLILCGKFPKDWEADLLGERPLPSLEASYRKLTLTKGDLHAALIHSQNGPGVITVLHADVPSSRSLRPQPSTSAPGVPAVDARQDALLPQTVTPPETAGSSKEEDVLIESPQDFREDARNRQPSVTEYHETSLQDQPQSPASNLQSSNPPISGAEPAKSSGSATSPITEEELDELADFAAHLLQPSAYAIPPQPSENLPPAFEEEKSSDSFQATSAVPSGARKIPPSIPRVKAPEPFFEPAPEVEEVEIEEEEVEEEETAEEESTVSEWADQGVRRTGRRSILAGWKGLSLFARPRGEPQQKPSAHAVATRQMAKVMVGGIQSGRRVNERLGTFLRRFIPRLLPGVDGKRPGRQLLVIPTYLLISIAIIIPVLVSVMGWVVFSTYGLDERYEELYQQALTANAQASNQPDLARQRDKLNEVIQLADQAIEYSETDEAKLLRSEAQAKLDSLMGVVRLEFIPAFANRLGNIARISRMAASESDLYMLDTEKGSILHASFTGRSLELDTTFSCQPGTYAGYQVGTMVDLLALPKINAFSATVLGIDASGHLLYCAPGQVPQAKPLPPLPNTNWGRVTSFALDSGNLYVLDASARAIWVFEGKDGFFGDSPYFYFSNQIPNSIENSIDMAVSGDDLYLLYADGHLSTCTFSRIAETPTRCVDPINFQDPFPAHQDINIFAQANFTQLALTNPPNSVLLLLDSQNQKVFRFTPRSLELQNQVTGYAGPGNPFQPGAISAMAVSPNYVLYVAIDKQVYFTTHLP
jgi:hypothetical protein